jgi:hypothetical protein
LIADHGNSPPADSIEDEWGKRPTVFRAGKLPKDLPPWFSQLDTKETQRHREETASIRIRTLFIL